MFRTWIMTVAMAIAWLGVSSAVAGDHAQKSKLPAFTPARESVVLEFVAQHHPELTAVIERLKTVSREQYEQAVRELFLETDKLTRIQVTDEELYALMLSGWKINSRIEVLAARLSCATEKSEALEEQLKRLIRERIAYERRMVEHRRKRLLESLEKTEANLRWFDENAERIAERRFQSLLRSAQRSSAGVADK